MGPRECTTIGNNFQNNWYLVHTLWRFGVKIMIFNHYIKWVSWFRLHTILFLFSNTMHFNEIYLAGIHRVDGKRCFRSTCDQRIYRSWSWIGRASWTRMNKWMSRDVYWNQFDNESLKRIKLIMIIHQNDGLAQSAGRFFSSLIFLWRFIEARVWHMHFETSNAQRFLFFFCFYGCAVVCRVADAASYWSRIVLIEFSLFRHMNHLFWQKVNLETMNFLLVFMTSICLCCL